MSSESFQMILVPAVGGSIFNAALFATFQPKGGNLFSVRIGSVTEHIADFLAYIIAWNPAITLCTDTLPHTIHEDCVVSAGGTVAKDTMLVYKGDVMTAAVEERVSSEKGVERILVGYGV